MSIRAAFTRLLSMFRRRQLDDGLDEEIRGHLELLAAEYERRGMTPAEAHLRRGVSSAECSR